MKESAGRDELLSRIADLEKENARLRKELARREEPAEEEFADVASPDGKKDFAFENLFDPASLQILQDQFARTAKVASLITAPDGTPLTEPSNFCRLCGDIIRKSPRGERNCLWFNSSFGSNPSDGPALMSCINSGLLHGSAPIVVGGRHIGNWLIGQVKNEIREEERIRRYAERLGVNGGEMTEAYGEVPFMDQEEFRKIAELLFILASQISDIAFENYLKKDRIERERRNRKSLAESEAYLKTVISSIPYPLWIKDRAGNFLDCNSPFENQLGVGKEQIIGRKDSYVLEILGKSRLERQDTAVSRRGASYSVETELEYGKEGRREWAEVIHTPIYGKNGRVMGTLGMGRSISEYKRLEEERVTSIRFFRELDRINSLMQKHRTMGGFLPAALAALIDIFSGKRVFIIKPAARGGQWMVSYEEQHPPGKGCHLAGRVFPPSPETESFFHALASSEEVLEWGEENSSPLPWYEPDSHPLLLSVPLKAERDNTRFLLMEGKGDAPPWTEWDRDLFLALARRITDALSHLIMNRDIQENEQFLSDVFESIPHMIFVKDAETLKFLRFNRAGEALLGYPREMFIGKTDRDFFTAERAEIFNRADRQVLASKKMATIEREYIRDAWGRERILHTKKVPILDREGDARYLFGISEDITDKIRMEEDLKKTTLWLESFMDTINDGFIILDRDSRIIHVNKTVLKYYLSPTLTKNDLIGRELSWLLDRLPPLRSPRYGDGFFDLGKKVLETGESFESEIYEEGSDSGYFFHTRLLPVIDGFAIVSRDITEKVKAEGKIVETNLRLESFLNSSDYLMGLFDEDLKLLIINDAVRSYLPADERMTDGAGRSLDWLAGILGDGGTMKERVLRLRQTSLPEQYEQRTSIGDKMVWHSYRFFKSGRGYGFIISDISEMKRLEEQLLQIQKIESIGRLAGGVAHDFNNMLSIIMGHAELALIQINEEDTVSLHLNKVMEAARRSSRLTGQLLAFARKQNISPRIIDLNDAIRRMSGILKSLVGERIELIANLSGEACPIEIDPSQMDQIVANLCVNARDAIGGNGLISLTTEDARIDDTFCSFHAECTPGAYTVLSVSDSGRGMDRLTKEKIFEPFFTTKDVGQGTGLGLSTVYGIMKQNGGFITVYSEREVGTTMKLFFPASAGRAEEPPAEEISRTMGDETILIVEDERMILAMASDMLRLFGYRVLTADRADLAEKIAGETERIDLILSDVIMPGRNGRELAEAVKLRHPDASVLFMSGYTADIIARQGVLDRGINFIQKPFTRLSLAGKVRQVLDIQGK